MLKKVLTVGVALLVVSGCAAMRANQARQSSLKSSLENRTMTQPADQVLNIARLVLVEQGFAPKDVGQGIIETDWKYASSNSYSSGSSSAQSWKYVVTAMQMGDATKLVVMKNSQKDSSGSSSSSSAPQSARDFQIELEILKRIDPESAAKIEADAEAAAQAAANS